MSDSNNTLPDIYKFSLDIVQCPTVILSLATSTRKKVKYENESDRDESDNFKEEESDAFEEESESFEENDIPENSEENESADDGNANVSKNGYL